MDRGRRRSRGFEAGGSFPPEQLGLRRGQARQLALHRGWRCVVGPVERRIRPLELSRGTLLLAIDPGDGDDAATLVEMLPTLVGRLAALCPRLGIRRFRVARSGRTPGDPVAIRLPDALDEAWSLPPTAPGPAAAPREERPAADAATRLRGAMERCLARRQKP